MKQVHFVMATKDDIETIKKLAHFIWNAHYITIISKAQIDYMLEKMYSKESILKQMEIENQHFFLAYIENKCVGYAAISTTDGKQYFLHKLYIDTNIHQKGIGTVFLSFLEEKYSPEIMHLTVNRQNFKAINFYFKYGFIIEKVDNFDIGNGFEMNDFVMVKKNR